jgi:hypothetical protein
MAGAGTGGAVGLSVALAGRGVDEVGAAPEDDGEALQAVSSAVAPPASRRRRVERRFSWGAAFVSANGVSRVMGVASVVPDLAVSHCQPLTAARENAGTEASKVT